jgi:hypothetical protein
MCTRDSRDRAPKGQAEINRRRGVVQCRHTCQPKPTPNRCHSLTAEADTRSTHALLIRWRTSEDDRQLDQMVRSKNRSMPAHTAASDRNELGEPPSPKTSDPHHVSPPTEVGFDS